MPKNSIVARLQIHIPLSAKKGQNRWIIKVMCVILQNINLKGISNKTITYETE